MPRNKGNGKGVGKRGLSPSTLEYISELNRKVGIKLGHYNRNYENPLQRHAKQTAKQLQFAGYKTARNYIRQMERLNKAIEARKKIEPRKLTYEQKRVIGEKFLEKSARHLKREYKKAGGTDLKTLERDFMGKYGPLRDLIFYTSKKGRDRAIERVNELYKLSLKKNGHKDYAFSQINTMQQNAITAAEKTMDGKTLKQFKKQIKDMSSGEFAKWAIANKRWLTKLWFDSDPDEDLSTEEREEYQEKLLDSIAEEYYQAS